jgi:NADH dehydrogenase/NADH:ubiquinone oxidoreductase subunit G
MGVVLNAQATNEDNWLLLKAATALGIERVYLAGRLPRPDRADDILRHEDVNPNTTGVRTIATAAGAKAKGASHLSMDLASGSLKALWILGDHVELDEEALAALAKLDLCIYQSPHETSISERANVVLPSSSWAEVDGTFTNAKGMVQRIRRAVEAPGESRPHHELIAMLARKVGVPIEYPNVRNLFHQMKQAVPEFSTAEYGRELPVIQLRFAGSRG